MTIPFRAFLYSSRWNVPSSRSGCRRICSHVREPIRVFLSRPVGREITESVTPDREAARIVMTDLNRSQGGHQMKHFAKAAVPLFSFVLSMLPIAAQEHPIDAPPGDISLTRAAAENTSAPVVRGTTPCDMSRSLAQFAPAEGHNIGPLTREEREGLRSTDSPGGVPLRTRIGITRALPEPLRVSNLTRSRLRSITNARRGKANDATIDIAGGRASLSEKAEIVWSTVIVSPDASGIRVELSSLNLPASATVCVSDGEHQIQGPYSFPKPVEEFWTNTIFAPTVYVQVKIPGGDADRTSNSFDVSRIAHLEYDVAASAATQSDITLTEVAQAECRLIQFCRPSTTPQNPTAEERALETASNGVAHINFKEGNGWFICSGGLVGSSAGGTTPYFLTAHHCFGTQSSASSLETFWRFRTVCGQTPPRLSTLPRTVGSLLLATSAQTDFTLVRLDQSPPTGSHFFRWSATDTSSSGGTVFRIHHPHGYSQHYQRSTLRSSGGCSRLPHGDFLYSNPAQGNTAGGSSGSLVFRIEADVPVVVGQLYGACFANPQTCGYANVDGAFAATYPHVQQHLGGQPSQPGTGPEVVDITPADCFMVRPSTAVVITARIRDADGVRAARLVWQQTANELLCPGTNNNDWKCSRDGDLYRWTITLGPAEKPRLYRFRATDTRGNETLTPERVLHVRNQ
jgi:hypothetical protein